MLLPLLPMPSPTSPVRDELVRLRPAGDPGEPDVTAAWVRAALAAGLLDLPLPGAGDTPGRLQSLASIGAVDLDVGRLAEAHTDAVAILAELDGPSGAGPGDQRLWGVWAANPPAAPVTAIESADGWSLSGTKPWCSGAGACDSALVTAQADDGYRLFAVDLHQQSCTTVDGTWPARAMRGSDSRSVRFESAPARPVGGPDEYVDRPGFWHGAVGVAAVWLGGAVAVADQLWSAHARRPLHPHALAHAGAVDAQLAAAEALLAAVAAEIDADARDESGRGAILARRARAVVETVATDVVQRVARALGPAPLALDADHAKRVADLELYLRQSHAERDLEQHGLLVLESGR